MATDPLQNTLFSHYALGVESPTLRFITQKVIAANGINLGQGTCQVPAPQEVINAAAQAMRDGINGYTLAKGLPSLRAAIAKKLARDNDITDVNPETEIIVTCGATGALEGVCEAFINPGDEVILFEPYYPYHKKTLEKFNATIRYVALKGPAWTFDEEELARSFGPKTKFVVINTPSNPCGKVFTREEILRIGKLCVQNGAYLITDEIYEYMVFDGKKHLSPASIKELRPYTFMIGGYSKTFAITGWRIGFLLVPSQFCEKLSQVLDLTYVCAPAPLQEGVARALEVLPISFFDSLAATYQKKRDYFAQVLRGRGLHVEVPAGSYYLIAHFSERFPDKTGMEFVLHMIEKAQVGAVPSQDFVRKPEEQRWARFCVAVEDSILDKAADYLKRL